MSTPCVCSQHLLSTRGFPLLLHFVPAFSMNTLALCACHSIADEATRGPTQHPLGPLPHVRLRTSFERVALRLLFMLLRIVGKRDYVRIDEISPLPDGLRARRPHRPANMKLYPLVRSRRDGPSMGCSPLLEATIRVHTQILKYEYAGHSRRVGPCIAQFHRCGRTA